MPSIVVPADPKNSTDAFIYYYYGDQVDELLNKNILSGQITFNFKEENNPLVSMFVTSTQANFASSKVIYAIFNHYAISMDSVLSVQEIIPQQAMAGRDLSGLEGRQDYLDQLDINDLVSSQNKKGVNSYTHFILVGLAFVASSFILVGLQIIQVNEAHASPQATRLTVSPIGKFKRVAASFLAFSLPSLALILILLLIYWQWDVGLSHDYSRVIATMFAGSLVAILLGMALAS